MKWKDNEERLYYKKYEKVEVKNGQGWFDVYRLPGQVYAICEPQHFQEVNVFLIIGQERALLLDTGMGICNIEPLVRELYDGEIIAVNSHFHFDHIGDNYRFEPVLVYETDLVNEVALRGSEKDALGNQLEEDMFLLGYPQGFNPEEFRIPPYKTKKICDGDRIKLGDRSLHVIHTPGHSDDSIMLYDEANKILFTGDSFYLGALYAHFDCPEFGVSDPAQYRDSLRKAKLLAKEAEFLYCSHNDFIVGVEKLEEAAEAMDKIVKSGSMKESDVTKGHKYLEGGKRLKQYMFDGFSVIVKDK